MPLRAVEPAQPDGKADPKESHFTAQEVFDLQHTVIFQDDFHSGKFGQWTFSEDDRYRIVRASPVRIQTVDAPDLEPGRKAVRFAVPRAPNSFRAEISLPSEKGFNERWYAESILVPAEWVFDSGEGHDIVMQWHAVPGNGSPTNPNLAISVRNKSWSIRQSFGEAKGRHSGATTKLDDLVKPGVWVAWVIRAKWSPGADGLLQIWKDGKLVLECQGANVYSDIGVEYTPYLKTGIYHPTWHTDTDLKRAAFDKEKPDATNKVIYATDVRVGGGKATYADMALKP
jgi:hypothetical protein